MLQMSDKDFVKLVLFIKNNYGINLSDKIILIESRLSNYVIESGFDNFHDYLEMAYKDTTGHEITNIVNRLTTNHTYFMREHDHFNHFMNDFLPWAEKNVKDHDLRIWSAGCSFGNEPYNLAMCMDEYFGPKQSFWDLKILATDISFYALKTADKGVYHETAMQKVPENWKEKYFVKQSDGLYRVNDSIRKNVVFKYHNLMDKINFKKKFDLIMCRNVMIYFDDETKSKLCHRFYDATVNGGYLYIGHAESAPDDMPYIKESPSIYRKCEVIDE